MNKEKENKILGLKRVDTKNKKINYQDYLKLKDALINLEINCKKITEENTKLNELLNEFQETINKNEEYKNDINKSFIKIKEKYNEIIKENNDLKNKNIDNGQKIQKLEEEISKILKEKELANEENKNIIKTNNSLNYQLQDLQQELNNKNDELNKIKNEQIILQNEIEQKTAIIKEKENLILNEKIRKHNKIKMFIIESKTNFIYLEGNNKLDELKKEFQNLNQKYNTLKEESNRMFLNRIGCSTNSSSNNPNKQELIVNNKLNIIKNTLIDNFMNTINIGYNCNYSGYNSIKKEYENNCDINQETFDIYKGVNLECEPIPSFLLCIQKASNNNSNN